MRCGLLVDVLACRRRRGRHRDIGRSNALETSWPRSIPMSVVADIGMPDVDGFEIDQARARSDDPAVRDVPPLRR